MVEAEGLAREIQQQIDTFLQELAALENSSVATEEDIAQLRADVQALEEELLRLQASALDQEGSSVRQFIGDGQRQYLSGMFLGGQRILVLMDSSASMLDNTLVNISAPVIWTMIASAMLQNGRGSSKRWTGSRRNCQSPVAIRYGTSIRTTAACLRALPRPGLKWLTAIS